MTATATHAELRRDEPREPRTEALIKELRSIRGATREATAVAIAAHVAAAEDADEAGDLNAASWHRGQAVKLQSTPRGKLTSVDWQTFWFREQAGSFLMEPIIARGRQVGLYGLAKDGKSELGLYIAAGCATGRDLYGGTIDPAVVLYLDWEMTEDDLEERLRDFGHGPDSDLSRLVYCHYPALPPMDTNAGGHALAAEIDAVGADLVIIDTLAKAVEGEENSADTYRRFAKHTGTRLRERACALLRLDHAGKDASRGARGSSAKLDDLDAVYRLRRGDGDTVRLDLTHQRIGWLESVTLTRTEDSEGVQYVVAQSPGYPEGTSAVAATLDELGAPVDIGSNEAERLLRDSGRPTRRKVALAAVRYRRDGNHPGTSIHPASGNRTGTIR